ncbi:MAG: class I SAM-dependent methyltransferase, partial [Candidatus Thiodiazotropha sp.]
MEYREADAEELPFEDASFDYVTSTFGVMFSPNQAQAASELQRVCKTGGA